MGLESHLVVTLQFRCLESFVYISLLSLNVKMYVYFVDFEDSPFDICRTVKLQSFSHLASEIICELCYYWYSIISWYRNLVFVNDHVIFLQFPYFFLK